jgi:hypothetical protein
MPGNASLLPYPPGGQPPQCCARSDRELVQQIPDGQLLGSDYPGQQKFVTFSHAFLTPWMEASYREAGDDEPTTFCAEAFVLISQLNFKGTSQRDIENWLWNGFRKSRDLEGCRVQSALLLGLLAYISET